MNKIIRLDESTRNKIAAGEVVERPVSVIKEMIENSLDANADEITIDLIDGGISLIKITDNGDGIAKEDIPLAFERYATSKINHFNDLFSLSSFGFRGEALASISTVSQIELESATMNDDKTHVYQINDSTAKFLNDKPYRKGTIILVKHLFYNVPVRKKFLSSINREFSLIYDLITKYSLAFPSINFTLTHQNELIFTSRGYNSTKDIFLKIYGLNLKDNLIIIENLQVNNVKINAWLVQESITKNTKQHEIFFINERLVKNKLLEGIVDEAYHTLIPKGRFPIVLIKFEIPSHELDVNIHPNKKEIKIFNAEQWKEELINIIKERLWQASIPKNYNDFFDKEHFKENINKMSVSLDDTPESNTKVCADERFFNAEVIYSLPDKQPINTILSEQTKFDYKSSEYSTSENEYAPPDRKKIETQEICSINNFEIIGQLNNTFILAQDKSNLYIIDQHTCHERILYEKLMSNENKKEVFSLSLLFPEEIVLSPLQEYTLTKYIIQLRNVGFILEKSHENIWLLKGLPKGLYLEKNSKSYFLDLLDNLSNKSNIDPSEIVEEILTTASCKGAVKANWELNHEDIVYLLQELKKTKNPHTCPHGRPIIIKLSMQELYTRFKRGYYKVK